MPAGNTSKWSKHKALRRHAELASILPETVWLTEASLRRMAGKYRGIVLKPTHKWGGQGIIFISRLKNNRYKLQADRKSKTFDTLQQSWSYVSAIRHSPWYIVQRRIPLATVGDRPFDIRVMVQRKRGGPWTVTGKAAKIAGDGFQVTNALRSNGEVVTLPAAFRRSSAHSITTIERLEELIDKKAVLIAGKLQLAYPGIRTIGLDMGIDETNGKVWLIEANFAPMLSLFRKLKDKSMYRTILKYYKNKGSAAR